ncbi:malto-oligosyltrehalose trehalohydrolase [Corynebacterium sp. TAE3-ERU30]|uniref:malto-oligosyltrehalose trehalohydrolase n=1 Tax=Corynebacterium sp. TAE3-ERU30 TaxID=2849496 RepID=UPI001C4920B9|nr:malto-oligosyltrehalose trehalohydrolase [Corynebacterium sp. TAE3-ERU30]MBV7281630.1 malto-oligosyltrehalose trehalohydrolase [Corynebacterium sp. TAE3-ERU30]
MKTFSVWAPYARAVSLLVHPGGDSSRERIIELHRDPHRRDVYTTSEISPSPGDRYGFILTTDNEEAEGGVDKLGPLPDPRSHAQPDGVHGLSAVVDHDYPWEDQAWTGRSLPGQVLYELHVGTFSPEGTFTGVINKLDHLVDLGVTAIELMPVQPFGGNRNWGYDGVSLHAVHAGYGGPDGLKALVDAAHRRGIAVVLDCVYNHFGPEGNYVGAFGPYTSGGSTGWGEVVNLNGEDSDEVRRYVLDAIEHWLRDYHIDGVRLDAVQALDDPGAVPILEEISEVARRVEAETGISRFMIAESDQNDPRLVTAKEAGGYGLDAQWIDDIHHALHSLVSGEQHTYYTDFGDTATLANALEEVFVHTRWHSTFRRKRHGRRLHTDVIPASRFVTYTTTHDQVGNRCQGDRPSQNLTPAQQVLKAATIYLSPYTPMLFQGEEFGATTPFQFFVSHGDEELLRLTAEGRLREFASAGWDPEDVPNPAEEDTFLRSKLNWDFDATQHRIMEAYRTLLRLRRSCGLADPWLEHMEVSCDEQWVAMDRGEYVFVGNYSEREAHVPFGGTLVYSFTSPEVGETHTTLGPWEFALIKADKS